MGGLSKIPLPPGFETKDTRLTDDEMEFFFKSYLTPNQYADKRYIAFICSYLEHRNASQAARASGLASSARQRPEVHACIEAITNKAVMKYGYDAAEMIERMKEIALFDPIDVVNPDGTIKENMNDIPPTARRAIKKFKAKNLYESDPNGFPRLIGRLMEIEFWDKPSAIRDLGSEKNVLRKTTVVQHDVTQNMKSVLLESGSRADERLRLMEARRVDEGQDGSREDIINGDDIPVADASLEGPWLGPISDVEDSVGEEEIEGD